MTANNINTPSRLLSTNRSRPCPICAKTNGNCRTRPDEELALCMTFSDSDTGVAGWTYLKPSKDGLWGTYVRSDRAGKSPDQIRAEREERERRRQEQNRDSLTLEERDSAFRSLIDAFSLAPQHLDSLKARGLDEDEIEGKFCSLVPNAPRPRWVSPKTPGFDGDRLSVARPGGIFCPAFDGWGKIVGGQVRLDGNPDGGKYRWLPKSHLPNGELPLTVARPPQGNPSREAIYLSEGFLKPYIAAKKIRAVFLGAAGGLFLSSPQAFERWLKLLSHELQTQRVRLCPDAGGLANKHVRRRDRATLNYLQRQGYLVEVGDWGQWWDKTQPDIDELPPDAPIRWVAAADYPQQRRRSRGWGFARSPVPDPIPKVPRPLSYPRPHRFDRWRSSGKYIFDSSATGTGKNYDAGRFALDEGDRAFFVTSDPRNPSVPTLNSWARLEGRHDGLARDAHGKLRRAKSYPHEVTRNCFRVKTISALRAAGIGGADSAATICPSCPHFEACRGGHLFGYLRDRASALRETRVIAHPAALPPADEFDYSQATLFWDEWETIFKNSRTLVATERDLERALVEVSAKLPSDQLSQIAPWIGKLLSLMRGKSPKYGWGHRELSEKLPSLENLDLEAIAAATAPDLDFLDPTAEYGVSLADLPAGIRKKFTDSDAATARQAKALGTQWLSAALRAAAQAGGYLWLRGKALAISVLDPRLREIAAAAKRNIFLDATGRREDLAALLNVPPVAIAAIATETPPAAEIEFVQVTGMGRLGQQRGNFQQQQADAVIEKLQADHPNSGTIRFKRYAADSDFRWFIESRGANDLETFDALVLDGIPCPNLESLAAEFSALYGRAPQAGTAQVSYPVRVKTFDGIPAFFEMEASSDPDFREFVRHRIWSAIAQGIGRLRASRRAGEKLKVYVLGDFPLPIPVDLVRASDITPDAATKREKFTRALECAISQLSAEGKALTQTAIARVSGYSQQYLSRSKELLQTLIKAIKSKSSNPPTPDADWLGRNYLPLALAGGTLGRELGIALEGVGPPGWGDLFFSSPPQVQAEILKILSERNEDLLQSVLDSEQRRAVS